MWNGRAGPLFGTYVVSVRMIVHLNHCWTLCQEFFSQILKEREFGKTKKIDAEFFLSS
jgi:hypothetical protein